MNYPADASQIHVMKTCFVIERRIMHSIDDMHSRLDRGNVSEWLWWEEKFISLSHRELAEIGYWATSEYPTEYFFNKLDDIYGLAALGLRPPSFWKAGMDRQSPGILKVRNTKCI